MVNIYEGIKNDWNLLKEDTTGQIKEDVSFYNDFILNRGGMLVGINPLFQNNIPANKDVGLVATQIAFIAEAVEQLKYHIKEINIYTQPASLSGREHTQLNGISGEKFIEIVPESDLLFVKYNQVEENKGKYKEWKVNTTTYRDFQSKGKAYFVNEETGAKREITNGEYQMTQMLCGVVGRIMDIKSELTGERTDDRYVVLEIKEDNRTHTYAIKPYYSEELKNSVKDLSSVGPDSFKIYSITTQ